VITAIMFSGVIWLLMRGSPLDLDLLGQLRRIDLRSLGSAEWVSDPLPLAMSGGDPYIRALMRTISASESNMSKPYHLLYGGKTLSDLSRHPDQCIEIVAGPNTGDCTTAAGRYQFLTTTWQDKAATYHPNRPAWYNFWGDYDFSPESQDEVVYNWLTDTDAWGVDIAELLRNGQIHTVLEMLSGTWTSLGYGIEDNSMSDALPQIYDKMLQEELR
jgi:muramidase (phage lysozyme)